MTTLQYIDNVAQETDADSVSLFCVWKPLMSHQVEDSVYEAQTEWIKTNIDENAAKLANYGWFVDDNVVETKVYGHGVLSTDAYLNHDFREFHDVP